MILQNRAIEKEWQKVKEVEVSTVYMDSKKD